MRRTCEDTQFGASPNGCLNQQVISGRWVRKPRMEGSNTVGSSSGRESPPTKTLRDGGLPRENDSILYVTRIGVISRDRAMPRR